jgi:hypothetical protein
MPVLFNITDKQTTKKQKTKTKTNKKQQFETTGRHSKAITGPVPPRDVRRVNNHVLC